MKADREKRAMILTAEGHRDRRSRPPEGAKQSRSWRPRVPSRRRSSGAEGERQCRGSGARRVPCRQVPAGAGSGQGDREVVRRHQVRQAHPGLLAYQYLQTLPQMAQGDANKGGSCPATSGTPKGFAKTLGAPGDDGVFRYEPSRTEDEKPCLGPRTTPTRSPAGSRRRPTRQFAQAVRAAEVARGLPSRARCRGALLGGGEQPEGPSPGRE